MSAHSGPKIANNTSDLGFYVDFGSTKSISGTALTDLSYNKIPVTLTNAASNTLVVANGYAEFNPPDVSSTASYYTISDSYFNNIKNEMTLETVMMPYQTYGSSAYVRGVSPRTTETSSPLGFSLGDNYFGAEVNTSTGWITGGNTNSLIGMNKWTYISQTTSVIGNSFITYINGNTPYSLSLSGTSPNGGNGILIGRGFYGGVRNYNGRVAFVKVYSRALNASEIRQNFNALRGRYSI